MKRLQSEANQQKRYLSRRDFLQAAAGSAFLLLIGCRSRSVPAVPPTPPAPLAASPTPAPSATPLPRDIIITPNEEFYVQNFQSVASVDVDVWRLTIDGLVENPLTLTNADVLARPRVEKMHTLECIGNGVGGNLIGNATWAGFWLDELLAEVKVKPEAVRARFAAADGYTTSVLLEWIQQSGVLMAYEMNGAPLPAEHGYPLRIFMPGLYGQKMPKWITRIEFIDDARDLGVWEQQGWSDVAVVKTNSQILLPKHISQLPMAEMEIFGLGYAGKRKITRVEVGVEQNGHLTWSEAEVVRGDSDEVWVQFYATWTPPAASAYTLLVRATDETGFSQSKRARGVLAGAFPDGTDAIHDIVVVVG